MKLNLPILDRLEKCRSILLTGIGGGCDIYAALPLLYELRSPDRKVHLASYSFADLERLPSEKLELRDGELRAAAGTAGTKPRYYPEGYLADWLNEPVWLFPKAGYKPVVKQYQLLKDHLDLDAIVMVDGGVDSLMQGDEVGSGTIVEDAVSMAAVNDVNVGVKILSCVGFGTEFEEQVSHFRALENIAALARSGHFLGTCSMTPAMECFQYYKEGYSYAITAGHRPSHIQSRIIPAVEGEFGSDHSACNINYGGASEIIEGEEAEKKAFLTPLMGMYWFFDFAGVAKLNRLLHNMAYTTTFIDARQVWRQFFYHSPQRASLPVPLT